MGFSLGANHILRYLGTYHHNSGVKACVSVSNPFDVLATTVKLKYRMFGLYDRVIREKLAKPFLEYAILVNKFWNRKKFKHPEFEDDWYDKM